MNNDITCANCYDVVDVNKTTNNKKWGVICSLCSTHANLYEAGVIRPIRQWTN